MLESDVCAALYFLTGATCRRLVTLLFLDRPQRIVVMVPVEASDYLLATATTIRQLGGVQVVAETVVPEADGRRTSQRQVLYRRINILLIKLSS